MNLKDLFNNFFAYTPKNNYEFDIPESSNTTSYNNSDENAPKEKTKIFPSLIVNIEYIKIDRDKSTFKSHRDFDSEIEMTFKHF